MFEYGQDEHENLSIILGSVLACCAILIMVFLVFFALPAHKTQMADIANGTSEPIFAFADSVEESRASFVSANQQGWRVATCQAEYQAGSADAQGEMAQWFPDDPAASNGFWGGDVAYNGSWKFLTTAMVPETQDADIACVWQCAQNGSTRPVCFAQAEFNVKSNTFSGFKLIYIEPLRQIEAAHAVSNNGDETESSSQAADLSDCSNTALIGDSIMVLAKNNLETAFPQVTIDAVSGKDSDWVQERCDLVAPSITRVVVGTGNNDYAGVSYEKMTSIVNKLGGRDIYLVTMYSAKNMASTNKTNETIKRVASERDNVYVVDWYAAASVDPAKYIQEDGCHPTTEGTELYANTLLTAIKNR